MVYHRIAHRTRSNLLEMPGTKGHRATFPRRARGCHPQDLARGCLKASVYNQGMNESTKKCTMIRRLPIRPAEAEYNVALQGACIRKKAASGFEKASYQMYYDSGEDGKAIYALRVMQHERTISLCHDQKLNVLC